MQVAPFLTREELLAIRSRPVRDLAWAIAVAPIVAPVGPAALSRDAILGLSLPGARYGAPVPLVSDETRWVEHSWFGAAWERMRSHVKRLGIDSGLYAEFCAATDSALRLRHGRRFELLLAWWFRHDPAIELLGHDIELHHRGRTIGQLDFLIDDGAGPLHLEVAIKFYLRLGRAGQMERAVGTDMRDRMDLKVSHLLFHQRAIGQDASTAELLRLLGLPRPTASLISLRGTLFDPVGTDSRTLVAAPATLQRMARELAPRWTSAGRESWFSPVGRDEAAWVGADDVGRLLDGDAGGRRAMVLIGGDELGETLRVAVSRSAP